MYILAISGVAIVAIVGIVWLFLKQQRDLLNRLMAKDFEQYKYYSEMFDEEVEELKKLRADARGKKPVDRDDKEIAEELDKELDKAKQFIDTSEEDWKEEDIDMQKLNEKLND